MNLISCNLDEKFGRQLFQIANILEYASLNDKKIVFREDIYPDLLISFFNNKFSLLTEEQFDNTNISILSHYSYNFESLSQNTRKKMQYLVYANSDYMYTAYKIYNDIKQHFHCDIDNDYVAIHFNDTICENIDQEVLDFIDSKHIINFGSTTYKPNEYKVDCDNKYIKFILLSFFKYHVCNQNTEVECASFISNYSDKKIIKCL